MLYRQKSSADLSAAITSMFKWYANAEVCYAYLSDVLHLAGFSSSDGITASRWFTRGWTLQELIAPKGLSFLDRD